MLALIVAAVVQGILEWLPVSSEAFLLLVFMFFGVPPTQALTLAIIFHLPTAFASILYYRDEYLGALRDIAKLGMSYRLRLIILATFISGLFAVPLYILLKIVFATFEQSIHRASILTVALIGFFMFLAGILISKQRRFGIRILTELNIRDSIFIGAIQGFAILPGITRSGITLAAFLYRKFDRVESLKGTFILAGPISLLAFIFIVVSEDIALLNPFSLEFILAIALCFIVSLGTMRALIKLAGRLDYPAFLRIFGLIMLMLSLMSYYILSFY